MFFLSAMKGFFGSPLLLNRRYKVTKKDIKIGDKVTVTTRHEAYYSAYGGNRACFMEPGDIGVVGAVHVPKVLTGPSPLYSCCIDFKKYGKNRLIIYR